MEQIKIMNNQSKIRIMGYIMRRRRHNNPGHKTEFDTINIIDQASNDMKLKIKELLDIIQKKAKL